MAETKIIKANNPPHGRSQINRSNIARLDEQWATAWDPWRPRSSWLPSHLATSSIAGLSSPAEEGLQWIEIPICWLCIDTYYFRAPTYQRWAPESPSELLLGGILMSWLAIRSITSNLWEDETFLETGLPRCSIEFQFSKSQTIPHTIISETPRPASLWLGRTQKLDCKAHFARIARDCGFP